MFSLICLLPCLKTQFDNLTSLLKIGYMFFFCASVKKTINQKLHCKQIEYIIRKKFFCTDEVCPADLVVHISKQTEN